MVEPTWNQIWYWRPRKRIIHQADVARMGTLSASGYLRMVLITRLGTLFLWFTSMLTLKSARLGGPQSNFFFRICAVETLLIRGRWEIPYNAIGGSTRSLNYWACLYVYLFVTVVSQGHWRIFNHKSYRQGPYRSLLPFGLSVILSVHSLTFVCLGDCSLFSPTFYLKLGHHRVIYKANHRN